jgi:DNA-binding NtrC family response regulator
VSKARKVLILNDDPDLVEMMTQILGDAGYDVSANTVRDLEAAVTYRPHVVLLDCPPREEKAILSLAQRMRLHPVTEKIPILLGTSSLSHLEPDILRDKLIHVLVRPYGAEELLKAVGEIIEAAERRNEAK